MNAARVKNPASWSVTDLLLYCLQRGFWLMEGRKLIIVSMLERATLAVRKAVEKMEMWICRLIREWRPVWEDGRKGRR